jgi:hypothetical protein
MFIRHVLEGSEPILKKSLDNILELGEFALVWTLYMVISLGCETVTTHRHRNRIHGTVLSQCPALPNWN